MYSILLRAAATLAIAMAASVAAVQWATPAGVPIRRTDAANIRFKLNAATAAKLLPDGDAAAVVQAALDSWNALPNTRIHFAPIESTGSGIATDGANVIAFADSAPSLAEVGSLIAATHVVFTPDGSILETDIILNPAYQFSTTLQPNTYDLQTVITHELGHALGSNHATVISAAMFWNIQPQSNVQAELKADDAAFAALAYPSPSADSAYGSVTGIAFKDGQRLLGAGIIAIDGDSGITIGGLSSTTDGSFSLRVPAGNYSVFAAPIGPLIPPQAMYNVPSDKIDLAFQPVSAGGPDGPAQFRVAGGAAVTAALSATGGTSAIQITAEAARYVDAGGAVRFGPPVVQAGKSLDFIVVGPGLDTSITEQNLRLIGSGVTIRAGTVRYDTNIRYSDGRSPVRFTIDTTSASRGAASLLVTRGSDNALLAGAVAIIPLKPAFSLNGIVDAASSKGAGVAPGELVSLYGTGIGPDPALAATGFDPKTGALPVDLGGVAIAFDGVAAPLLFVSQGQVNFQVPYETAGKSTTKMSLTYRGVSSDAVTVPVLSAQPGLFLAAGTTQAIAVNQDGSVNGSSAPAPKGTYVTFYATGGGSVTPAVPTGRPAPNSPLSFAQSATVSIGGTNAVVYQGAVLAPSFVGLLQVSAQVPDTTPSGNVPVILTIAGQASPTATIAVK